MSRTALKIVESPSFYEEKGELWVNESARESHSLHYALPYPSSFAPELAAYCINRFSKRGQVVLDPFCGSGTTALEAAMAGRIPYSSDVSPLAVKLTRAKLEPIDISEVTLWLQQINLSRPVGLDVYQKGFRPFFDTDTFRELMNLKMLLASRADRGSRFIELVALSLLHGHSAGYFSVYSFPQVSLSSSEQERINQRRNQYPDYRAVIPRLLRKSALMLRDGIPSVLRQSEAKSKLQVCDARDLSYINSQSVDLVIAGPPLPGMRPLSPDLWMRLWYAGISQSDVEQAEFKCDSLRSWLEFMNEVMLESARVVKGGGRLIFELKEVKCGSEMIALDQLLLKTVEADLYRFWDAECLLIHQPKSAKLKHALRERDDERARSSCRLLVLRRR